MKSVVLSFWNPILFVEGTDEAKYGEVTPAPKDESYACSDISFRVLPVSILMGSLIPSCFRVICLRMLSCLVGRVSHFGQIHLVLNPIHLVSGMDGVK